MPTETQRRVDVQSVLLGIQHDWQPQQAVEQILSLVMQACEAQGASITLEDEGRLHFVAGDAGLWLSNQEGLGTLSAVVPDGLAYRSALPAGLRVSAQSWYTARLQSGVVIAIWFSREVPDLDTDSLMSVFTVLALAGARMLTARKAEQANQLAKSIISSIRDPLLVLSEDRDVVMMNPAAESVFDIKIEAAYAQPLAAVLKDETLSQLIDHQNDAVQDGQLAEWSPAAHEEMTFLPNLAVVETPDGMPNGWVLALRDVSQFKRLNRNQQEFLRVVSHDLRSPLTAMQGFADMIRMGLVGEVTEKQVYFVDKILSGVDQMTGIVDNIQDAGRFDPETGFYEMGRTQVDVGELAAKIVQNHIIPAEKQELSLELRVDDDVPIIYGDENMLMRGITNLVDNAIKYTPNGGRVQVLVLRQDEQLVVSVADNGLGISEEDQQRLFQRHFRIARREHNKVKGTGLGLFIVRSVAQRHGGDAKVESEIGKGTTFSIMIPLNGKNVTG